MNDTSSRRPRVLHILPNLGIAGAESVAAYLMLGLAPRFDVGAVSLYPRRNSFIEKSLEAAEIPIWHLRKQTGFAPGMFFGINRAVGAFRPDIIHTHLYTVYYTLPAAWLRRIPVWIHTVHNLAEREVDRLGQVLEGFAFKRNVVPVAVGRQVALSLERRYRLDSVATIPNGIRVDSYRSDPGIRERWRRIEGFGKDALIVTCVGRLHEQKNPLLLLRAFARARTPDSHLVLIGGGTLRERLLQEACALNVQDRVHLLGSRDDVRECLAASDVFALSSDWEGAPLSVMEAMAAGLPIVSSAVGDVPELLENGVQGFLVAPGDCPALSIAIGTLLRSQPLRCAMGKAAQARAEAEFDAARMVQGYARLYSRLLVRCGVTQPASPELVARG